MATRNLSFSIAGAASARISCWIDFNKNGNWIDANEYVIQNLPFANSVTSKGIGVPANLSFPNGFPTRCRIYPTNGSGTPVPTVYPYGQVEFGEVEDHIWQFDANGLYVPPTPVRTYTPLAGGPTNTPTPTPTDTNTPTATFTPTATNTPTATPTDTNTPTPTFTPTPTDTPTPTNTPTPAAITDLAIAADGTAAKLTWTNPSPNDSAQVLSHSTNPYFAANDPDATPQATVMSQPWMWSHTGVLGGPTVETVYYIVLGRVGLVTAGASNRVGMFEFGLTQGLP